MPVILPFRPSDGSYRFRSILLGSEYLFRVRWNSVDRDYAGSWFFDVLEFDERPIVIGIKIVLGVYYGRVSTHPLFREGAMVPRIPHGDDRREPGFDDMGTRVQVWYFTRDEVAAEIISGMLRVP